MKDVKMKKISVVITTKDEKTSWGYVMVAEGERLQDFINDDRKFIPCFILKENKNHNGDEYKMKIISKDFINFVEEN